MYVFVVEAINPVKVVPIHTFFPKGYNEIFSDAEWTTMVSGGMSKIEESEIRKISPKFMNALTSQEGILNPILVLHA